MRHGKVKRNVRKIVKRTIVTRRLVYPRKLGRSGKKERVSPVSRQLRWRRSLILAVNKALGEIVQKRAIFGPIIFPAPAHLDLNRGYSWTVVIETTIPLLPPPSQS